MMLRERCLVAGVVGLGLLAAAGFSPGQAPAHKPKVVQPDNGSAPEQAVQPDQAAPLDQTMPRDPGLPPEEVKPPEEIVPEPVATPPAAQPAATPDPRPAPAEPRPVVAAEPVHHVAATPEQALLEKEAEHLLELTQELKAEVEKAGTNALSLAAVRKADEVQKLSKDLKERMKDRGQVTVSKP